MPSAVLPACCLRSRTPPMPALRATLNGLRVSSSWRSRRCTWWTQRFTRPIRCWEDGSHQKREYYGRPAGWERGSVRQGGRQYGCHHQLPSNTGHRRSIHTHTHTRTHIHTRPYFPYPSSLNVTATCRKAAITLSDAKERNIGRDANMRAQTHPSHHGRDTECFHT